ncbi:MAG: hypothetical protein H7326_09340 [Bdellovibrionaceae bacterium]|nr:hypothetical protein [Pseudobdellovibrionaceae bacterium]
MKSFPKVTPRENTQEKNLIAEQPGRLVLFFGVVIALILGLSMRGMTAPSKIKSMVQSAASRIHKDVTVEFARAELSLHRGLLPRFAVIIYDVRMESMNECWMSPQLIADEIRLPLSLWSLVQGENPIRQVEGGKVDFYLRSRYKNCENAAPSAAPETPKIKQFVTLRPSGGSGVEKTAPPPPPEVEAILIDQLRLVAPQLDDPLELSGFGIRLKSNSPRVIEMTAQTHLMKDTQVAGDYLSHASVWAEYTEFPQKFLRARLSGNWREGSYQLKGDYSLKDEALTSELDLKHIPMNQIFQIFRKLHWLNDDLNARQVWVSMNAKLTSKSADIKKASLFVSSLNLEGDLGDLSTSEIHVTSLEPLRYAPFVVDVQRLGIEKVLALSGRQHPTPVLGQLGKFTGSAKIFDPEHIEFEGMHRGLEFIFANKGQRELQTLKEIAGKMTLQKNQWSLEVKRFVPDQGSFDGDLVLLADREFKNIDIKAKAKELTLSPSVVRLMTAGGDIGAFDGDLQFKFRDGRMSSIKGTLNSDHINVEGVRLQKSKLNIDFLNGEIITQVQAQKLNVRVGSPAFLVFKDLISPEWMTEDELAMKSLSTQLRFKDKALAWKNFQTGIDRGGIVAKVSSDGSWDQEGYLSGLVTAKVLKGQSRWIVGGKRDLPVFTLKEK